MNRFTTIAASLSGVLLALTGVAYASATRAPQRLVVAPAQSDSNLRWAIRRTEENIDMLQRDRHDYNGFRARAIASFRQAREQLDLGLAFDRSRERVAAPVRVARPDAAMVYMRGDCASDLNLNVVRRNVERIIDFLQKDNRDYGGHRAAAVQLLSQGRESLRDAIAYDNSH